MSKNRIAKIKKFTKEQENKLEEILTTLEAELIAKKVKEIKLKYASR